MPSDMRVPRLLRVREVEKLTGIERWRLYEMFKRAEGPPYMRIGATIRVPADSLVKWIEQQTSKTEE